MRNRGSLHGLRGEPRRHRHRRPIPGAYPPLLRRADRNSRTACSTTALNPRAMGTLRTRCPEGGDQAGVTPQRRPPRGLRPAASENPGLSDRIRRNTQPRHIRRSSPCRHPPRTATRTPRPVAKAPPPTKTASRPPSVPPSASPMPLPRPRHQHPERRLTGGRHPDCPPPAAWDQVEGFSAMSMGPPGRQ